MYKVLEVSPTGKCSLYFIVYTMKAQDLEVLEGGGEGSGLALTK